MGCLQENTLALAWMVALKNDYNLTLAATTVVTLAYKQAAQELQYKDNEDDDDDDDDPPLFPGSTTGHPSKKKDRSL